MLYTILECYPDFALIETFKCKDVNKWSTQNMSGANDELFKKWENTNSLHINLAQYLPFWPLMPFYE